MCHQTFPMQGLHRQTPAAHRSRCRLLARAGLVLSTMLAAVASAQAQKGQGRAGQSAGQMNAAAIECVKQSGGAYDPETKKWVLRSTELHSQSVLEAVRDCISRRTGTPRIAIVIPEIPIY